MKLVLSKETELQQAHVDDELLLAQLELDLAILQK
jgi:hypothetical protein